MSNMSFNELSRLFDKHIDKTLEARREVISTGQCSDYAAYKFDSGYNMGLLQAKEELRTLIKRLADLDEED